MRLWPARPRRRTALPTSGDVLVTEEQLRQSVEDVLIVRDRQVRGSVIVFHGLLTLEPARALAICRQLANALDAAHSSALVHRDVKPSNVLLDENEHVYLTDFGLTRRLEEQDTEAREGRSIGTPAYLAPEQIEGQSIDGRADVY